MDLHIIVSTERAGPILEPLAKACTRANCQWTVFFTNDGVKLATNVNLRAALEAAASLIACHDSWDRYVPDAECPVELGSQTNNSELVGTAQRVISL